MFTTSSDSSDNRVVEVREAEFVAPPKVMRRIRSAQESVSDARRYALRVATSSMLTYPMCSSVVVRVTPAGFSTVVCRLRFEPRKAPHELQNTSDNTNAIAPTIIKMTPIS
jgi:hypothetical protein